MTWSATTTSTTRPTARTIGTAPTHNYSWNYGVEGPTDDPAIVALRARQKRNLLATLLIAQGTPMLLGGDEFGRTQQGNNNAYCQDNEISWFDWERIGPEDRELIRFVARLIRLRKAHPVLRRTRFLHGEETSADGLKDITWFTPAGTEKTPEEWRNVLARCIGLMLNGRAGRHLSASGERARDDVLLILLNAYHEVVPFTLPTVPGGATWQRLLDTFKPEVEAEPTAHSAGQAFDLSGRSLVLFVLQPGSPSPIGGGNREPR